METSARLFREPANAEGSGCAAVIDYSIFAARYARSFKRALFQSKRLDCRLVDCSGNRQALVTLVIGQSSSCLDVQRTRYRLGVIPRLLQGDLNIRDRLIG